MFFHLGQDGRYLTPFHEAISMTNCIGTAENCFKFPLSRIQSHDTGIGLRFYFELYVYNIAGHFTTVRTDEFKIPSRFPPSSGKVIDINNLSNSLIEDVDFQTDRHVICARWFGFGHHRNLTFEIGLGDNETTDNIVSFYAPIGGSSSACLQNLTLNYFKKYFVSVRANCSGGYRVTSSDGIIILNETLVQDSVSVHNGKKCFITDNEVVSFNFSNNDHGLKSKISKVVSINNVTTHLTWYAMKIKCTDNNIASIIIQNRNVVLREYKNILVVDSFPVGMTDLYFTFDFKTLELTECKAIIYNCSNEESSQYNSDSFRFHLETIGDVNKLLTHYEIGLFQYPDNAKISELLTHNIVLPFSKVAPSESFIFSNLNLQDDKRYAGAVKLCFGNLCLGPQISKPMLVNKEPPTGTIAYAEMKKTINCFNITISFEPFKCKNEIIDLYEWSVFQTNSGLLEGRWQTLVRSNYMHGEQQNVSKIVLK